MRKNQLSWALLITSSLLFFQNCGKFQAIDSGGSGILVSAGVTPNPNAKAYSADEGRDALPDGSFMASPLAVDFGSDGAQFLYRIILATGEVIQIADPTIHELQLTAEQMASLNQILDHSQLSSMANFPVNADLMCAQAFVSAYASIHTNYGAFDIGAGASSCNVIDLFKNDSTGTNAGLKEFLEGVTNLIVPQVEVTPEANPQ